MQKRVLGNLLLCCVALVAGITGCATMFSSKVDTITIDSEPSGADVYLGDTLIGQTPLTRDFKRETFSREVLIFRKDGYHTERTDMSKTIAKSAWFNLGFITTTSGLSSWGIDAASGMMFEYAEKSYLMKMTPLDASKNSKDFELIRYGIRNYEALRKDIARSEGENLRQFYVLREEKPKDGVGYSRFLSRVEGDRAALLAAPDGVALYRRLRAI